jgi:peptidoglycan/LPS O-acetylase OafA/YrhL
MRVELLRQPVFTVFLLAMNYQTTSEGSHKKPAIAEGEGQIELNVALPKPLTGRLPALDELKGIAILLVVLYHAGGVLAWRNLVHGDLGVDIFVILSGMGLTLSARVESTASFLRRRFWRIYPAYWLVLGAYLFANAHFLELHYSIGNIAAHILGIQAWFGDGYGFAINDSFWFVTLIVSLYVLYCALKPVIASSDRLLLAAAAVCVAASLALFYTGQAGIFGHVALRLPGFFIGLLVGRLLRTGSLNLPVTAAMAAAVLIFTYIPYTQGVVYTNVSMGLCIMGAYVWLARPLLPERARTELRFLGDRSLEIFLIHQPLIRHYNLYVQARWLNNPAPSPSQVIIGMAVALVVTLILSQGLHTLMKRILPR